MTQAVEPRPFAEGETSSISDRMWVVVPCMGRLESLRKTAPRLLAAPEARLCLVDYSCPEACGAWLEREFAAEVAAGRVLVERVQGERFYNKSRSMNAGAWRAMREGAEYLCFLDADTIVLDGFYDWVVQNARPDRFLITGRDGAAGDDGDLCGTLVVHGAIFTQLGGFDVDLWGYGAEDIEMCVRLHALGGLDYAQVPRSLLEALHHDGALRDRHHLLAAGTSTRINAERIRQKLAVDWRGRCLRSGSSVERLWFRRAPKARTPIKPTLMPKPIRGWHRIGRRPEGPSAKDVRSRAAARFARSPQPSPAPPAAKRTTISSATVAYGGTRWAAGTTAKESKNVWMVVPCMGRLSFIKQTAPAALAAPNARYCLVDYSCPEHCGEWLEQELGEQVAEGRAVVERVPGQRYYNKSRSHNAGAWRALRGGADYLCFLDADTLVTPDFYDWLVEHARPDRFFIAAQRPDGFDERALTGMILVPARAFVQLGAFDVDFSGWGGEDIELRLRLHLLGGLSYGEVPLSLMQAIQHDVALRTRFYRRDARSSGRANIRRIQEKLQKDWYGRCAQPPATADRLWFKPPPEFHQTGG